jgi:hypothetical protein
MAQADDSGQLRACAAAPLNTGYPSAELEGAVGLTHMQRLWLEPGMSPGEFIKR